MALELMVAAMITNCADVTGMRAARRDRFVRQILMIHLKRRMPKFGKLDAAVHYFNAEDV